MQENSNFALERIHGLLKAGQVDADGKLPTERALSEMFGVSRRAVRRALEVLEAEGEIWRRQGSGTYVGRKPDGWTEQVENLVADTNFMEVMEVRLRIEPQLAQLAALRAKSEDVASMRRFAEKTFEAEDSDARELWDGALHRQLAQSAGNSLFLSLFEVINRVRQDEAWRAIRRRARLPGDTRPRSYSEHLAIITAIEARDPARAGEAMRRHLLRLQEDVIRQTSMVQVDMDEIESSAASIEAPEQRL
ncbi:FadR/GntR family transcriptional regulator [Halotalea alkalilenta]|uniref:GntR family transcriptional regulator n=1 Tax=Halotalea alkalilenta TaxID=376489 RepID=A0A172YFU8_9GAMM|nr:FCD domain-containing protein [Halotalea alkalilenta]ANF58149.1 GntR family transcriptional regulator [Halotalea alkalilenta]